MKKTIKAFSFVEIIIVISILITIGIVASTSYGQMQDKSNNSKITSDIITLNNAFDLYIQDKNSLPMPGGNLRFYSEDTGYKHSFQDNETFGVSGFITDDIIPSKYLNITPIDPRTNQYYGYGKTKNLLSYEIAGVNQLSGNATSIVNGNWSGLNGPYNLVRSYNGPDFVYNNSNKYFPYNPSERLLVGYINSYSGSIKINSREFSLDNIKNYELKDGNTIEVESKGWARIFFNDGSEIFIGDENENTIITLDKMIFEGNNNLTTNIAIMLDMGSLWNKASSLGGNSSFFKNCCFSVSFTGLVS